jgi:hypothetical protein
MTPAATAQAAGAAGRLSSAGCGSDGKPFVREGVYGDDGVLTPQFLLDTAGNFVLLIY